MKKILAVLLAMLLLVSMVACGNEEPDNSKECNHTPGDWIIEKEATCKEEGSKYKKCTVCDAEMDRETIAKGAHKVVSDGDCTTAGVCSVCGVTQVEAFASHKYTDEFDTACNNPDCTAPRTNEGSTDAPDNVLLNDNFDVDMKAVDAGWNNNKNVTVKNGTLNITHTEAEANTRIYKGFTGASKVTVEFDFALNYENDDNVSHAIIRLRSYGTDLLAIVVRRNQMKGTQWANYDENLASGEVHKMKIVADADTDTYAVYLDDVLMMENVELKSDATAFNEIVLGAQGNGSGTTGITVSYDNLVITAE